MNATEIACKDDYIILKSTLEEAKVRGVASSSEELKDMLWGSVPVRGRKDLLRCGPHTFRMDGSVCEGFYDGEVPKVQKYRKTSQRPAQAVSGASGPHCETCDGTRKIKAYDECPECEGLGCEHCEDGLVPTQITCPACAEHQAVQNLTNRRW